MMGRSGFQPFEEYSLGNQMVDGQQIHAGLQLPTAPNTLAELKLHVKNRAGGYAFQG